MKERRTERESRFAGVLLRSLAAVVLVLALTGKSCDDNDQKGKPPNEGPLPDHCERVGTIEVSLEVDMSQSISALDHWLDINHDGELKKAFRNCCTEFTDISAAYDNSVPDYPEDYADCEDKGWTSRDVWCDASMHLILAKKIEGANVLGYTYECGPASGGSSSWVFVQRIDELIGAASSNASREAFGTREATHELGHHRACLSNACYKNNGIYYIDSAHCDERLNADGDCIMATPYVLQNGIDVRSVCGSTKSQLWDIYFCFRCREAIKTMTW